MGANVLGIDTGSGFFGLFYSVHKRLLTHNYTPFREERQLFAFRGLPGAALAGGIFNDI
jgi:hypothetical protein